MSSGNAGWKAFPARGLDMKIKQQRILFRVGEGSFAVTLPKMWISYNKLKHGDTVEIIANDDIVIRVKTEVEEADEGES